MSRPGDPDPPDIDGIWPGVMPETEDDLGDLLRNVRVTRLADTRRAWANSWQTRAFLLLGLRLLHEHQTQDGEGAAELAGINLWAAVSPERLADLAQQVMPDPAHADALSVVRWKETWGHRAAYTEDLVTYLFGALPHRRRREVAAANLTCAPDVHLAALIDAAAHAEYVSAARDPLVGLQTWLQAAMPLHPAVRRGVIRLERTGIEFWAGFYAQLFPTFGLHPRPGVTWLDVAELFATLTEGVLLRARPIGEHPRLPSGGRVLGAGVTAMVSGLFDVRHGELERRFPVAGTSR